MLQRELTGAPRRIWTSLCPAIRTCSALNRFCLLIICWLTTRCSSATGSGFELSRAHQRAPLGAGALAGTAFPSIALRRQAAQLSAGFKNSIDTVSDRDFILEFISAAAILFVHLSRLAEELVLWSSQEFGFVELPDRYCTGSSMMPQKKNPDVPELVRGKAGRVFGHLQAPTDDHEGVAVSL